MTKVKILKPLKEDEEHKIFTFDIPILLSEPPGFLYSVETTGVITTPVILCSALVNIFNYRKTITHPALLAFVNILPELIIESGDYIQLNETYVFYYFENMWYEVLLEELNPFLPRKK